MVCFLGVRVHTVLIHNLGGHTMTSEELQAKVSKLEQQTEKNAKAIAKLNKQVTECKYLIKILSDNSKY